MMKRARPDFGENQVPDRTSRARAAEAKGREPPAAGGSFWRDAQFDTLRLGLIKVTARVTEMATRITVSLPTSFVAQHDFAALAARIAALPP